MRVVGVLFAIYMNKKCTISVIAHMQLYEAGITALGDSVSFMQSSDYTHTHTHTYIWGCVCVCVYGCARAYQPLHVRSICNWSKADLNSEFFFT